MTAKLPHLDCEITKENLHDGVGKIVAILRPDWNSEEVLIEEKSTGYINTNYALHQRCRADGLFLRIFSMTLPQQKERSLNVMNYLKGRKLGAELLLTFENGIVMEFLDGDAVTWDDIEQVKKPEIWLATAREMAKYHLATDWNELRRHNVVNMEDFFEHYLQMMMELYYHGNLPDAAKEGLPTPEKIIEIQTTILRTIREAGAEKKFCHFDTNPTNILIRSKDDAVIFVDYDDCCIDYPCIEITRFFNLFCGTKETDFSQLPTREQQETFVLEYLQYLRQNQEETEHSQSPVTNKDVQFWMFLIRKCMLLDLALSSASNWLIGEVSDKLLDPERGRRCWQHYLDICDEIMTETLEKE